MRSIGHGQRCCYFNGQCNIARRNDIDKIETSSGISGPCSSRCGESDTSRSTAHPSSRGSKSFEVKGQDGWSVMSSANNTDEAERGEGKNMAVKQENNGVAEPETVGRSANVSFNSSAEGNVITGHKEEGADLDVALNGQVGNLRFIF